MNLRDWRKHRATMLIGPGVGETLIVTGYNPETGTFTVDKPFGQSRRWSFMEAVTNILVGYIVALSMQLAVFPMFGIHVGIGENLAIGALFTVVSLVRSYCLRRCFNWLHTR